MVERVLGEGGMGLVVAAVHRELGHRVAIKTLLPGASRSDDVAARFQREARAAAALSSEHAARVTDVGTFEDGMPFMVMEFLEGEDLERRLARGGALPLVEGVRFFAQSCVGLGDAHTIGIVHRDVKPSNVFLARKPSGRVVVKVLDFGIAKAIEVEVGPSLTRTSNTMGSPRYMSPEQLANARDVDARTDVWSLGATFYEALTGRPAFDAESLALLHVRVMTGDPTPARELRDAIPPALEAVLARCLAKDPSLRYPSMRALQEDLERVEVALAGGQTQPTSYPDLAPPPSSATREAQVFARTVNAGEPAAPAIAVPLAREGRTAPLPRADDVASLPVPVDRADGDAIRASDASSFLPDLAAHPAARPAPRPDATDAGRRGADVRAIATAGASRAHPLALLAAAALLGALGVVTWRASGRASAGAHAAAKAEGAPWYDEILRRVSTLERLVTGGRGGAPAPAGGGATSGADTATGAGDPFEEAAAIAVRGASDAVCGRPLIVASATLFAPSEAALLTGGTLELQRIAPLLARYPERGFVVLARVPIGDAAAASRLSLARANAVVAWLRLNASLARTRLVAVGAASRPGIVDDPSAPGGVTSDDRVEIGMACGVEPAPEEARGPAPGRPPKPAKPARAPKGAP